MTNDTEYNTAYVRRFRQTPEGKAEMRRYNHSPAGQAAKRRAAAKRLTLINEFKNVPCANCDNRYPYYVMDFDHRDPAEKSFDLARGKYGRLDAVIAEIEKCDVVCANCHRIRTHKGLGADPTVPSQDG